MRVSFDPQLSSFSSFLVGRYTLVPVFASFVVGNGVTSVRTENTEHTHVRAQRTENNTEQYSNVFKQNLPIRKSTIPWLTLSFDGPFRALMTCKPDSIFQQL